MLSWCYIYGAIVWSGENWKHIYILISMWKMDPSCRCGFGIEDPYHFLFTCPLYVQITLVMLDSISHISSDIAPGLSLLLWGDINLTFDQNKAIFENVQVWKVPYVKHDQQPCTSERIIGVNVGMCVLYNIFLLCCFLLYYWIYARL